MADSLLISHGMTHYKITFNTVCTRMSQFATHKFLFCNTKCFENNTKSVLDINTFFLRVCTHIQIPAYLCKQLYTHPNSCLPAQTPVHTSKQLLTCANTCTHIQTAAYLRKHLNTHPNSCLRVQTPVQTSKQLLTFPNTCTHIQTAAYLRKHLNTHPNSCLRVQTPVQTSKQLLTFPNTCTHIQIAAYL